MKKLQKIIVATALTAVAGIAFAQAPAAAPAPAKAPAAAASTDPIVDARMKEADIRKAYKAKVDAAKKARAEKMKPMVESSVKEATAKGPDPLVAKRDAESKAKAATKADYAAAVKAAKQERDAALAPLRKKEQQAVSKGGPGAVK